MRGTSLARVVAVAWFFVISVAWSQEVFAAYTPAQCLNVIPGANGLCFDKTGFGHCNSTDRDMGSCTTADDHCCVNLATVPGITKAQCDAKPGFAVSGGCLVSADDWGVKITDLGAGDWACCKYSAGLPGPGSSCTAITGTVGTCNSGNCPSGTSVASGATGCAVATDKCCVAGSTGGGGCTSSTGVTGSCSSGNCPSGTSIASGASGCPIATDKCCINSSTVPTANIVTTTFDTPTGYTTVNEFLGKVLSWLQGVLGMLALVMITIGGFMYITSAGDNGRTETAKKLITAAVIGFAIAIAAPSFLRELSIILNWGPAATGLPPGVGTSLTFLQILQKALDFLLSIVGIVAIIMLVVGGIMYLTSAGDEDRIDTGKSIVKYAMIGIGVALGALVLVRQLANFFS